MLRREWLDSNGTGGYASSTLFNCHTRKYHGLLVANLPAPACGRHVLLSKIEDSLLAGPQECLLTASQYPGVLAPAGGLPLAAFELTTHPTWTFKVGPLEIRRSIAMLHGEDAVLTRYAVSGTRGAVRLRLRPFLAFRRNHGLARENAAISHAVVPGPDGFRVQPYAGMPELYFQVAGAARVEVLPAGYWYRDFEYREEQRRGYDCREDLFLPAILDLVVPADGEVVVAAATRHQANPGALWGVEMARRETHRLAALTVVRKQGAAAADLAV